MPAPRAGKLKTGGTRVGRSISVDIKVDGVARTSDEFKRARRELNARIRDVMAQVGQKTVLPDMRGQFPSRWGDSLFIQRERSGVFVGSRLRGTMNRALGWWDFGGKRPMDRGHRKGPKVLVRTLDRHRERIDDLVVEGLMDAFDPLDHTP